MLSYIKNSAANAVFVLLDFHPYLQDAVHVLPIEGHCVNQPQKVHVTVMLAGYSLKMPEEAAPLHRAIPDSSAVCR